jgi:AmiR/NasT family two-component response regulator
VAPRSPDEVLSAAGSDGDRLQALEAEVAQLRTAMVSRAVIEQAKGVLMLLTGCTDQAAFDLLTHISSHTHRKVRDVAQELVGSATGRCPLPEDVKVILRDACPPSSPLN